MRVEQLMSRSRVELRRRVLEIEEMDRLVLAAALGREVTSMNDTETLARPSEIVGHRACRQNSIREPRRLGGRLDMFPVKRKVQVRKLGVGEVGVKRQSFVGEQGVLADVRDVRVECPVLALVAERTERGDEPDLVVGGEILCT